MEQLKSWEPLQGSVLRTYTRNTPCEDIFQAVCNELGEYYKLHGFKYAKSGPHITGKVGDIRFKLAFWSSRSNTMGEYVNLEMIPSFKSISLEKKLGKEESYIWGHPDICYRHIDCSNKCDVIVRYPFEPDLEREDTHYKNRLILSNNVNLWDIDEDKFVKLVNFINEHIVNIIYTLQDEVLLRDYLSSLDDFSKNKITSGNSKLSKYLNNLYPEFYSELTNRGM